MKSALSSIWFIEIFKIYLFTTDRVLLGKVFDIAKVPRHNVCQREMVYKFNSLQIF